MDDPNLAIPDAIPDTGEPTMAVAICTKDRVPSLCKTIESIWAQNFRLNELIVIDDGSMPDETWEDIAFGCQDLGIIWKYQKKDEPGLTRSRNFAAEICESDVILYLDDDVTCEAGSLKEISQLFVDGNVGGVTANVIEPELDNEGGRRFEKICKLARWWEVRPTKRPTTKRPEILAESDRAVEAKWMSGAAMAYRTALVLRHRFDESLSEYALGEDREFGYRLAPHAWLIEAKRSKIIHRRESSGRANPRRFGFMTSYNYLYILNKNCAPRGWRRFEPYWSLAVMAGRHIPAMFRGEFAPRAGEVRGMAEGVAKWITSSRSAKRDERQSASISRNVSTAIRTRVMFVTNRLEPGGAERMLLDLVRLLPSRGIDPVIVCLQDEGPMAEECRRMGVPVHAELLKFKTDFAAVLRLERLIKREKIDICVAAHSGGDRMFWTTLAGKAARKPVVVWSHWHPTAERRHLERSNRALLHFVDRIIALGDAHRKAWIDVEHAPSGKVEIVHNGIDVNRFEMEADRDGVREELGLSDSDIAVALIANFRPEKRHDVFISTAKKLSAEDERFKFFIIGTGSNEAAVRTSVAESGLASRTLRMLGPRNDVSRLLSGLDACCLCSDIECFSVVMLEAAAAGCPFIGPAVGSMPEFLSDRETGLVIKPANPSSLADALRVLAADPALRKRMIENAKAKVTESFSLERVADRFAAILSGVRPVTAFDTTTREASVFRKWWVSSVKSARAADCRTVR